MLYSFVVYFRMQVLLVPKFFWVCICAANQVYSDKCILKYMDVLGF